MADEEKKVETTTPSEIVDKIIALTYTRHAGLPYEEFAEKTGLDKSKDEETAVREGKFKLIRALTKQCFEVINEINGIAQLLKLYCEGENDNGRKEG